MNISPIRKNFISYSLLAVFSFFINYYFANLGLHPIDTFSFFESGYLITQGYHPVKDFWVISGIVVDYLQALFFLVFGNNWNSYIFHSSIVNSLISVLFLFFLNNFNKNLILNLLLSFSFAVLCYPVSGTPFPYQHSYIFSLASMIFFYLAVSKEKKVYWFVLPISMFLAFFSMQMPSGIIIVLIILFSLIYYLKFDKSFLKPFTIGVLFCLTITFFYLVTVQIDLNEFLIQMFLFPLTIGEARAIGDINAFESANLINKLTLRGTLGHFKFIFFFIFSNLIMLSIFIKKNKVFFNRKIILNIFVALSGLGFIFHQLITANQTFIFSLIPLLGGFVAIQLKDLFNYKNKKADLFFFLFICLITIKYHGEYNLKRKFMDLQNVNLENAVPANKINDKFKNLKWITPFEFKEKPNEEIKLINKTINVLDSEVTEEIMLITHYQFFSLISDKKFNILNRWYFSNNNTHPTNKKNKYYDIYTSKINYNIKRKNIKKIFIIESKPNEFDFINFNDLLKGKCFDKEKYNLILYSINIKNCN